MKILHLSDTHGLHHRIKDMPEADVIVHSGDIHKIFVTGNHDLCLWDAEGIEDLPTNIHFLQDKGVEIDGVRFFGIAYNHSEELIPIGTDIVITHEPPVMILDQSISIHWGNAPLRKKVMDVKPRYHLFGHAHQDYGIVKQDSIVFSNAALLDDMNRLVRKPRLFNYDL